MSFAVYLLFFAIELMELLKADKRAVISISWSEERMEDKEREKAVKAMDKFSIDALVFSDCIAVTDFSVSFIRFLICIC